MMFADFDRVVDRASMRGADAPDPHDLAACLSDLAKAFEAVDRRMDRIHDFLPPEVRKAIDASQFLDTFMAYRTLKVHAATLQGFADADDPNATCPYPALRSSERAAWLVAHGAARKLIGEAA